MVLVSYSGKEINAKLVYYGPGLSGKTTNLEFIYGSIPQTHRGKMVSMKTKTERTLFFDFLPVNLGELAGFKTRFLLYTVPGQVYYNATRKLVLKGVDAVVFVADSKRGKMDENVESLENLKENLREHGLSLESLPWVIQYNKRDLPDVYSVEELEQVLNPERVPHFEAVAMTGGGVVETFKAVSKLLLRKLSKEVGVPMSGSRPSEAALHSAEPVAPELGASTASAPPLSIVPPSQPAPTMAPPAAAPVTGLASGAASFGSGEAPADVTRGAGIDANEFETRTAGAASPPAADRGAVGSGFTVGASTFEFGAPAASRSGGDTPPGDEGSESGQNDGSGGLSVADRLRRWLGGRKDTAAEAGESAPPPSTTDTASIERPVAAASHVPAGALANSFGATFQAAPAIPAPAPSVVTSADPGAAAAPREIDVPVWLEPQDLANGIVLRLSVRVGAPGQTGHASATARPDDLRRAA